MAVPALFACASAIPAQEEFSGRVIDAAGRGVKGLDLELVLNERTTGTDTAGYYHFDLNPTGISRQTPSKDASPSGALGHGEILFLSGEKRYQANGQVSLGRQAARFSPRRMSGADVYAGKVSALVPEDILVVSTFGYYQEIPVNTSQSPWPDVYLYNPGEANPMDFEREFCWWILEYFAYFRDHLPPDPDAAPQPDSMYQDVGEPYTVYYDREYAQNVINAFSNKYSGMGVFVDSGAGGITISRVISNSPAEEAGVESGDVVQSVDGVSLPGISLDSLESLLGGENGDSKTLGLLRNGTLIQTTVTLQFFVWPSVYHEITEEDSIPYIYLSGFFPSTVDGGGTADELIRALDQYQNQEYLILDIRDNGGGDLEECVRAVAEFVPANTPVIRLSQWVYDELSGTGDYRDTIYATFARGESRRGKVYVLMDGNSASASEVFIACLMENRPDITFVGEVSFGKARAQYLFMTPLAAMARVTNSLVHPINLASYDQIGIQPGVQIGLGEDAYEAAVRLIREDQGIMAAKTSSASPLSTGLKIKRLAVPDFGEPWLTLGNPVSRGLPRTGTHPKF